MTIVKNLSLDEPALEAFAAKLAAIVKAGDVLLLSGDLGAGKTTLARALIRAIAQDSALEVQSPTFPLLIPYETARFPIAHYDLYRLGDASELEELGLYDGLADNLTLVEWPEQLDAASLTHSLRITLQETACGTARTIALEGTGRLKEAPARLAAIETFLEGTGWSEGEWAFLQGDASTRSYIRLTKGHEQRLLMNAPPQPDGPPIRDGKPYSQIAHLAEDMTSFVAISRALNANGLKAPRVEKFDIEQGLLLISDFGNAQFYEEITSGRAQPAPLYEDAIDCLIALYQQRPDALKEAALPGDPPYSLPAYDAEALQIEADLVIDWHWPHSRGADISQEERAAWHRIWTPLINEVTTGPRHWVLRDFHSPNLMQLEGETANERVGIIDFQDALQGHAAYDAVSLCQDARLTVPAELEENLLARYCSGVSGVDPAFDGAAFRRAYAILGAQRASKLLGIFVRLAVRDGKAHYLAHIPRIWEYLARNLAHPALAELAAWYHSHFPENLPGSPISAPTTQPLKQEP